MGVGRTQGLTTEHLYLAQGFYPIMTHVAWTAATFIQVRKTKSEQLNHFSWATQLTHRRSTGHPPPPPPLPFALSASPVDLVLYAIAMLRIDPSSPPYGHLLPEASQDCPGWQHSSLPLSLCLRGRLCLLPRCSRSQVTLVWPQPVAVLLGELSAAVCSLPCLWSCR